MLAKVVFRARTRFFHKLQSLNEIIEELQGQVRQIAGECDYSDESPLFPPSPGRNSKCLGTI